MLHGTILGLTLKGLGLGLIFLAGKAYLRKADACNHKISIQDPYCNKYLNSILFFGIIIFWKQHINFLESNTVLHVLFTLIPVNKD